ncbi:MAG: hypothetical protein IJS61_05410 [Firmicutes bacterium]|nr:hypothetical protein [Bacillota bacterium]
MDKKVYESPSLTITALNSTDVITLSGLTLGNGIGKPQSESFKNLFAIDF